ncbi:substrate-binding domain-containing protein [Alphaproteobacteria bacterium]|nr:substrate-binding domain-containing protein [Alphaproteobacteria bacterium]
MLNVFCNIIFLFFFNLMPSFTFADDRFIIIQSTTSLKNSGFYDYILPIILNDTGIKAKIVGVGSGAAIRNSMNCDGDILIVHSPKKEKEFVSSGYADFNHYLMHNHFIIIGPKNDPANIKNFKDPYKAFQNIFNLQKYFVSRGDKSGTHDRELQIWERLSINPKSYSGKWYLETGSSMGATINIAIGLGGYTLTDRATWIKFSNKKDLIVMVEDNKSLINPYSIMAVSRNKCPNVKENDSNRFINWLLSEKGRIKISKFKAEGKKLFYVDK